ncbi:MAG: hypothetical protein K6B52_01000, partial [Clostridiales bacterium]|nr:hypothetical protein [Clostridiales bacterium]
AVGEIYKYATLCRELGEDHEKTKEALNTSVRAIEAILLLMHVCKRGNGFVARSYMLKGEPLPDDGIFFVIHGDKAVCAETTESISRGCNGIEIDASCPIPERLRHLFTDEGGDEEGLIYKADTSSDEITGHVITLVIAHRFLAKADPELDELIVFSLDRLVRFIIDGGLQLIDYSGESTTWAKWNEEYFNTPFGYVDACLNSAQMLMYLKAAMYVTGEEGIFKETYDTLINEKGYADLTVKHFDRMYQSSLVDGIDYFEDIMYGDHMLAVEAFWGLCMLEKDPVLLQKYRTGFKSWKSSIKREYNPGYYFPFLISCPDETIDMERMREWFSRFNVSRLASGVSLIGRHDVPVRTLRKGYKQTSYLLPNDEQFISKYDRDPFEYKNVDSGGTECVESCYVYTFAYWIGRYYGFLGSEED